ncbi:MAG TPA: alpha/beta hydrolase [Sphingomicrobium sp.]|nr:alpha/beta hydrolase [Sphingomicrobium sp.]
MHTSLAAQLAQLELGHLALDRTERPATTDLPESEAFEQTLAGIWSDLFAPCAFAARADSDFLMPCRPASGWSVLGDDRSPLPSVTPNLPFDDLRLSISSFPRTAAFMRIWWSRLNPVLGALALLVPTDAAEARAALELARRSVLGAGVAVAPGGVKVTAVAPGSPAFAAGLEPGDVIVTVGGAPVADPAQFVALVRGQSAGKRVPFEILRNNARATIAVMFAIAPLEKDPQVITRYEAVLVDGTLRRTLVTIPRHGHGRHPAVLIVGGIGCYSIDNSTPDEYARLAHALGRRGIVVMRLEKSGVGDSQGQPCSTVDYESESRSYARALDALGGEPSVDPDHLFLLGHSIGTLTAPRLAAEYRVAGVIVAEAVGRNWLEYELLNLRRQLALDGTAPAEIDDIMRSKELCAHRLLIARESREDLERQEPDCKEHIAYPAADSYMQQVAALNIARLWTKVDVPVLAIYGTADFVTDRDDHQRIVDIVNSVHSGQARLALVAGMDHHLDQAGTPEHAWDLRVKQHQQLPYDRDFEAVVADWICSRSHCAAATHS